MPRRFQYTEAPDAMKRPPPAYWDKERLCLRTQGGSTSLISASYSNLKTTFEVWYKISIAKATGARVLYIVAESSAGFGTMTLNAIVTDWNTNHPNDPITDAWLRDHFKLVEVPVNITDEYDIEILKSEISDWKPNIIVIDPMGACAIGKNLSLPEVGTQIGHCVRQLAHPSTANPWAADVTVLHHFGRNEQTLGSIYFQNDAEGAIELEYDRERQILKVKVTKAKWGELRTIVFGVRKVYWVDTNGDEQESVVPYELSANDPLRQYEAKAEQRQRDKDVPVVVKALEVLAAVNPEVTQDALLDHLAAPLPGEDPADTSRRRADWRKNRLPRTVWEKGRGKVAGRQGPLYGLLKGAAIPPARPTQPNQPYVFLPPVPQSAAA
jgi:hypothetical protein